MAGAISRWDPDPDRGSFRGWLARVARNTTIKLLAARRPGAVGTGNGDTIRLLEELPSPEGEDADAFDLEYRRRLFRWALDRVWGEFRESTWEAFRRTSLEDERPKDVAEDLGISVGAVYVYRNRIMSRVRREIEQLEAE